MSQMEMTAQTQIDQCETVVPQDSRPVSALSENVILHFALNSCSLLNN